VSVSGRIEPEAPKRGASSSESPRWLVSDPPPAALYAFGVATFVFVGLLIVLGGQPSLTQALGTWVPVGLLLLLLWTTRYTGIGSDPDPRRPLLFGMLTAAIPLAVCETLWAVFA
jgi:hypothetical protein